MVAGLGLQEPAAIFATWSSLADEHRGATVSPALVGPLVACFAEASAFGLETLAATTGLLSPLLLGLAVSVALLARGSQRWANTGTFTAVTFAVGAGLPGASMEAAVPRLWPSLLGALFALLGVGLHRLVLSRRHPASGPKVAPADRYQAQRR